jgi:carboxymethylenebutenolidase
MTMPAARSPIDTTWTTVPTAGGTMDAYLALPPAQPGAPGTPRQGPGLLLLQEIFGVNEHIRGVAEQYALAGFTVIAPDLFWRQGRRIELDYVGDERERALALMKTITRDEVVADMTASLATLKALPECRGRGVGAIGWCMGGRLAYTAAALCGVDAAVAYYGGGIAGQLELASKIACPMMFHHAGQDAAIPPEAVAAVKQAMAASPGAAAAEFHDYADAQHGFNCWARATYHAPSAALALGRSVAFLARLF